jgi:hypothetical protein
MRASCLLALLLASTMPAESNDDILTAGPDLSVDVSRVDGRLVIDLAGNIWTLPATGGQARLLLDANVELRRPRWSPTGDRILFQSTGRQGMSIWLADVAERAPRRVSPEGVHSQDASWHPDGDRIVFASDRHDSGLDIWETDLPTGLSWRLTDDAGDESAPVWSANGRHLAWISNTETGYALMLRRRGEPDVVLVQSQARLSSPAWRTDGSLLTFLRHDGDQPSLEMAILSDPVLVRVIGSDEKIVDAPVSWRDRHTMFYTADGKIRHRGFEDRRSRPVHFRAIVTPVAAPAPAPPVKRELEVLDAPEGRLIVRAARLFDGLWTGYRIDQDVVIDGGRVTAIESRQPRADGTVLDLGNVTIIPGLVDAWSTIDPALPSGAAILAYGVTTIITDETDVGFDFSAWEREETPGPRVLQIEDAERVSAAVSIADSATAAIGSLLSSRQALAFGHTQPPPRRFAAPPPLEAVATSVVAGSKPNRMPPGIALHAELLALSEAGLTGEQALHAAGRNAAKALGLEFQVGTIMPGALADLVLVRGDPLAVVGDSLNVVAVVRNGRFFSLISLLERAKSVADVE